MESETRQALCLIFSSPPQCLICSLIVPFYYVDTVILHVWKKINYVMLCYVMFYFMNLALRGRRYLGQWYLNCTKMSLWSRKICPEHSMNHQEELNHPKYFKIKIRTYWARVSKFGKIIRLKNPIRTNSYVLGKVANLARKYHNT